MRTSLRICAVLLLLCCASVPCVQAVTNAARVFNVHKSVTDEFVGPFASWANLKRDYGAKGDGQADDTTALQKALDDLKLDNKPKVLYLPAGTYRITQGLQMISHYGVGVIGEDPDTTIIKWDGAPGGTMLLCNGVRYSRFGRIGWDGAGKASAAVAHQWDGHTPNANSHNEHADEVFKDVGYGIRAGLPHFMDAECAVLRCRFFRCSSAGVSIESFNALDWWIWNSLFEDCRVGVTNDPGAGHFHVYRSLFRRSTEADIKISNTSYFGIRDNTSIGSRAFFIAGWIGAAAQVTLLNNTIVDPTGPTVIQIGNVGPCLLLGNDIRGVKAKAKGEHIVYVNRAETTLAVDNHFDMADAIDVANPTPGKKVLEIGDRVTTAAYGHWGMDERLKAAESLWPGTPPNLHRKVFEIAPGADGAAIQAAINEASRLKQQRAIVHLPAGTFSTTQTLVIPSDSDVQLVGDGFATQLKWTGTGTGPVLLLKGPSQATMRDMEIVAGAASIGISVENCNQLNSSIFMEQGEVSGAKRVGLLADNLDRTDVSLHDFYHSGCGEVGVRVVGGNVSILGGASSSNALCYDITNNANLLVEDTWYEGAPPRFLNLTAANSGTLTINGATTATGRPGPNMAATDPNFAAIAVNGFHGNLSLLGVIIGTQMVISGTSKDANVLVVGHGTDDYFFNRSTGAHALLYGSTRYTAGGGGVPIPNQGKVDPPFIRQMLMPLLRPRPHFMMGSLPGTTDVRFYRVTVTGGETGIRLGR